MVRFLIRVGIYVGTAALALILTSLLLTDFRLSWSGSIVAVGVFTLAQSILAPFIVKTARRFTPAVLGGIGLISTFAALLLASLFPGGIALTGIDTWLLATLIVWVLTTLGGWLLPKLLLRGRYADSRSGPSAA